MSNLSTCVSETAVWKCLNSRERSDYILGPQCQDWEGRRLRLELSGRQLLWIPLTTSIDDEIRTESPLPQWKLNGGTCESTVQFYFCVFELSLNKRGLGYFREPKRRLEKIPAWQVQSAKNWAHEPVLQEESEKTDRNPPVCTETPTLKEPWRLKTGSRGPVPG